MRGSTSCTRIFVGSSSAYLVGSATSARELVAGYRSASMCARSRTNKARASGFVTRKKRRALVKMAEGSGEPCAAAVCAPGALHRHLRSLLTRA